MQLEQWDATAKVTYDRALLNELVSLRFLDAHAHVASSAPSASARPSSRTRSATSPAARARRVLASRADKMLKTLQHARLDHTYEAELRSSSPSTCSSSTTSASTPWTPTESRDAYEILTERHRSGSIIVTSNRGPDEWLATFADPMRAQAAIDRFTNNAYDLVIDGETYRKRQKPTAGRSPRAGQKSKN